MTGRDDKLPSVLVPAQDGQTASLRALVSAVPRLALLYSRRILRTSECDLLAAQKIAVLP